MNNFCPNCEELRQTRCESRTESYRIRGEDIAVSMSVEICETCGEALGNDDRDEQIITAARKKSSRHD